MTSATILPFPRRPRRDLAGIAMGPADHACLTAWAASGRRWRLEIAPSPDRFEELAHVYLPSTATGPGDFLAYIAFRAAATGEAVVVDERGAELGRAADMADALEAATV